MPSAKLICHEDNDVAIRVCQSGRNQSMRYLGRTHGISVAWLHEQYVAGGFELVYAPSLSKAADIFTESFSIPDAWGSVCWDVFVCDSSDLSPWAACLLRHLKGALKAASGSSTSMGLVHGRGVTAVRTIVARSSKQAPRGKRATSVLRSMPAPGKCSIFFPISTQPRWWTRSYPHHALFPSSLSSISRPLKPPCRRTRGRRQPPALPQTPVALVRWRRWA